MTPAVDAIVEGGGTVINGPMPVPQAIAECEALIAAGLLGKKAGKGFYVHKKPGDAVVPAFGAEWREVAREDHPAEGDRPAYSFVTLERAA